MWGTNAGSIINDKESDIFMFNGFDSTSAGYHISGCHTAWRVLLNQGDIVSMV